MRNKQKYTYHETEDFDKQGRYTQFCPTCGRENVVKSQADNSPEYHTTIYTECIHCGQEVEWTLPVN